jgi:NTE family protein
VTRSLVLGGGGVVGTAWMFGLLSAWRRRGIDLDRAEQIVGTSAGAIVAAVLALGGNLDEVADGPRTPGGDHLANLTRLLGTSTWPARPLSITVTDAATSERHVLDRASGWDLPAAVAASTAYPGAFPPVVMAGRTWIDGGLRSATNADLADGADRLLLVEPLAHLVPSDTQVGPSTVHVVPDEAARCSFGHEIAQVHDPTRWSAALAAGRRQGAENADDVATRWRAS